MMSDAPPVVVVFALPDESRDFVASLAGDAHPRAAFSPCSGRLAGQPVIVVHTGVGDTHAGRQRLQGIFVGKRPKLVISAGYAGGLHPTLRVGDLVLGENFSAPALLPVARALLAGVPLRVGALLTRTAVAETAAAKAALQAGTGALAVDMETGWIANVCACRWCADAFVCA